MLGAVLPVYILAHAGNHLLLKAAAQWGAPAGQVLLLRGLACLACVGAQAALRRESPVPRAPGLQALRMVVAGGSLTLLISSYSYVNATTVAVLSRMDIALLILLGGLLGERRSPLQYVLAVTVLAGFALYALSARAPGEQLPGYILAGLGTLGITIGFLLLKRASQRENPSVTVGVPALAMALYGLFLMGGVSGATVSLAAQVAALASGVVMWAIYRFTLFLYRRMDVALAEYPTLLSALLVLPLERRLLGLSGDLSYVWFLASAVLCLGAILAVGHGSAPLLAGRAAQPIKK